MAAAIVLDVIIIAIVAFTVIRAVVKGLITVIFDMGKFIAAIILAAVFKNPLAEFIMGTQIFEGAKSSVTQALIGAIENAGQNISSELMLEAFENENPAIVRIIEMFGASFEEIKVKFADFTAESTANAAEAAAQYIIEPAATACSQVIAFALIFLLSLLVLWIAYLILDALFKLPVLKQVNKTGGLIVGIIAAFLYVSLFVALASPLLSNTELFGITIPANLIENTVLFSFFKEHNLFYYVISLFGEPQNLSNAQTI